MTAISQILTSTTQSEVKPTYTLHAHLLCLWTSSVSSDTPQPKVIMLESRSKLINSRDEAEIS